MSVELSVCGCGVNVIILLCVMCRFFFLMLCRLLGRCCCVGFEFSVLR